MTSESIKQIIRILDRTEGLCQEEFDKYKEGLEEVDKKINKPIDNKIWKPKGNLDRILSGRRSAMISYEKFLRKEFPSAKSKQSKRK